MSDKKWWFLLLRSQDPSNCEIVMPVTEENMTVLWGHNVSGISVFLQPSPSYRDCFLQTLGHHVRHLCQHLPGSAHRWKTFILCLVSPPCPSSFQYNSAELEESAVALPRASASLPEQKGASSHFGGLHRCQSIHVASGFQTPQWCFAPQIPRQIWI